MSLHRFWSGWWAIYDACRAPDYPCPGCEVGRLASARAATGWAWRNR